MHKKPLDGVSVETKPLLHLDLARRAIGTAVNSTNRAGTAANRNGLAAACAALPDVRDFLFLPATVWAQLRDARLKAGGCRAEAK